jgi:hypothetical protein
LWHIKDAVASHAPPPLAMKSLHFEVMVSDFVLSKASHEIFRTRLGHEMGLESSSERVSRTNIDCRASPTHLEGTGAPRWSLAPAGNAPDLGKLLHPSAIDFWLQTCLQTRTPGAGLDACLGSVVLGAETCPNLGGFRRVPPEFRTVLPKLIRGSTDGRGWVGWGCGCHRGMGGAGERGRQLPYCPGGGF